MATTDLNQDHVMVGAEALQREDWENNRPLIHYVPAAEAVLAAVGTPEPVDVFNAWIEQDGLREAIAEELHRAYRSAEWESLSDFNKLPYRETADEVLRVIREFEQ